MIDVTATSLVLAAGGGVMIGLAYFAALWWNVRRLASARHPALLVAGSYLVRAALAAGGIVFVAGGEPLPLAAAVAGFLAGRTIMIRVVAKPQQAEGRAAAAADRAGNEARE